jgi:hypothetical protein
MTLVISEADLFRLNSISFELCELWGRSCDLSGGLFTVVGCCERALEPISLRLEHQLYDFCSLVLSGLELPLADRVNGRVDQHRIST